MTDLQDAFAVQQLLARFANSFDRKDWSELGRCLSASLYTDYTDLRGTPAEMMTREQFVESRRSAQQALNTHHLAGNLMLELEGSRGEAQLSMAIFRRNEAGEELNTHCIYRFGVERSEQGWVINSIVQKVLWSEGQKRMHRSIRRPEGRGH